MNTNTEEFPVVQIGQDSHSLETLTNSYFVIDDEDVEVTNNSNYPVVIHHPDGEKIETSVRSHMLPNKMVKFRFNDLSINDGDRLKTWSAQFYKNRQGDTLNNVTYDQIAKGDSNIAQEQSEPIETKQEKKSRKPLVAVVCMSLVLMAIGYVVVTIIAHSNYVALANGALIGNYQPIQASSDGILTDLMVQAGDEITEGQVLFTVRNSKLETDQKLAEAEVYTNEQKVKATEKLIEAEEKKLELVATQLQSDIRIAKIDRDKSYRLLASQQAVVDRLMPLMQKRYVSRLEFKKETDLLKELQAALESKVAEIDILESRAKTIVDGKLYFLGGNVDNSISNFQADLILQEAELSQAKAALEVIGQKATNMEVRATNSGRVYAIYRESGEYVEAKDGVLAINRNEQPWAFATVRRNKSVKIKEGDKVKVKMPAYDNKTIEGTIASIGHRALYTEAGWSHDFRVDNSENIPVKVSLSSEVDDIPTGTRLKLVVPLPLDWSWK